MLFDVSDFELIGHIIWSTEKNRRYSYCDYIGYPIFKHLDICIPACWLVYSFAHCRIPRTVQYLGWGPDPNNSRVVMKLFFMINTQEYRRFSYLGYRDYSDDTSKSFLIRVSICLSLPSIK